MLFNSFTFNTEPDTIDLNIADISIRIRLTHKHLLSDIRSRFHKFCYHTATPSIIIDIHLAPDICFPNPDGSNNFFNHQHFDDANTCFVRSNYFTGYIDIERRYGKLVGDADNPLSWLEHFLRISYAVIALKEETLLFHGAGLVDDEHGYIFFGPSGVGKSTVTNFSGHCAVLGDDLIAIKPGETGFQMYATPFNHEENGFVLSNSMANIKGFYRLVQDCETYIRDMKPARAITEMLSNIPPVNNNKEGSILALTMCTRIINEIPCYELHFTKNNKFWRLIDGHIAKIPETQQELCFACG